PPSEGMLQPNACTHLSACSETRWSVGPSFLLPALMHAARARSFGAREHGPIRPASRYFDGHGPRVGTADESYLLQGSPCVRELNSSSQVNGSHPIGSSSSIASLSSKYQPAR